MKKILPLIADPPVKAYQYHAFPLGILFQHEKFIDYFAGDYVNLRYNILDNAHAVDFSINYFNSGMINYNREIFMKNSFQYSLKSILDYSRDDFIHMAISMINLGFYAYSLTNAYYLPNRRSYYRGYGVMDCLIYGYDTDSMTFNSIGYCADGIYKEFQIPYEDYFKANLAGEGNTIVTYGGTNTITFLKINPDFDFCFNLANLRRQLYEYLNSISTTNIDIAYNPFIVSRIDNVCDWNVHSIAYGLEVYDFVINNILTDKDIYTGHVRILLEHKKCMRLRLEYLLNKNYLKDSSLLSEYEAIVNDFELILNLFIKNSLKFSETNINRIAALINTSVGKEKIILGRVLDTLNMINIQRNDVKEMWDNIKNT